MRTPLDCRIGLADLASGRTSLRLEGEPFRRRWLGGRGVNIALLLESCPPGIDPLDPAAPFLVGAGLLSGLPCPSPARVQITGKSPESGLLADSSIGGHFAPALRRAGFDHLLVTGASPSPVYLLAENGTLSAHGADDLWGLDALETMERLKERHGPRVRSLCIGPAGERLVRFACVRHGLKSAAGKGGLGCLMGSKGLKAVAAIPGPPLPVADRSGLARLMRDLEPRFDTPTVEALRELGTPFLFDQHTMRSMVRTRNDRDTRFEAASSISSLRFKKFYDGRTACFGCRIGCRHTYQRADGRRGEGLEYGALGAFGPNCGLSDPEDILAANDLCSDLGLDVCAAGNTIAWAMECFEEGLLTEADTGGLRLAFGDAACVLGLLRDMGAGQGFGAVLGQGVARLAERFGQAAADLAVASKGATQTDPVDVRGFKGFALAVAVSTRGADHLRGRPTFEALNLDAETLARYAGGPVSTDPRSCEGKARLVIQAENEYALGDALGVCRFAQRFNSPGHLGPEDLRALARLATGLDMGPEEFTAAAERILAAERLFVGREAGGRVPDGLPARYFRPLPQGRRAGERVDPEEFQAMLREYYGLRGCDPATGLPDRAARRRLGLEE